MTPNILLVGPAKCVCCGKDRDVLVKFDRAPPVCRDCVAYAHRILFDTDKEPSLYEAWRPAGDVLR